MDNDFFSEIVNSDLTIYIGVAIICFALYKIFSTNGNKTTDKIPDYQVDIDTVVAHLNKFSPTTRENRKTGFTEKDVHDDLEEYLKTIFYSVTREYGIEGKNAKKIDFDIGNGKVGVEVKLAESAIKEGEGDRLLGQMQKYIRRKYNDGNFILAVAGFKDHTTNTVLHEIQEDVLNNGGYYIFLMAEGKNPKSKK